MVVRYLIEKSYRRLEGIVDAAIVITAHVTASFSRIHCPWSANYHKRNRLFYNRALCSLTCVMPGKLPSLLALCHACHDIASATTATQRIESSVSFNSKLPWNRADLTTDPENTSLQPHRATQFVLLLSVCRYEKYPFRIFNSSDLKRCILTYLYFITFDNRSLLLIIR